MKFFKWIGRTNFFLFITCTLISRSMALPEKYDLLEVIQENIETDWFYITSGNDGFSAIELIENVPVNTTLDKFHEPFEKLNPPFEIYALITLDIKNSPCLFSISVKDTLKLALCFELIQRRKARIKLQDSEVFSNNKISFLYSGFEIGNWTNIIIRVEKNKVELYIDCKLNDTITVDNVIEEVQFMKESLLILGQYDKFDENFQFGGSIQNLQIFPNPDSYGKSDICNDKFKVLDSTERNSSTDKVVTTPKPQNLEFLNDVDRGDVPYTSKESSTELSKLTIKGEKGEKGEKGDKGVTGDRGDKGKDGESIIGPIGPEGPEGLQGPPGKAGDKGQKGECKTITGPRGDPGPPGPRGDVGEPGPTGLTGLPGEQGERGPPGLNGKDGEPGNPGAPGADGLKGEPGKDGRPGPPGSMGLTGPPGPPGPIHKEIVEAKDPIKIEKGDTGPIGPPGIPGRDGKDGLKGDKGDHGIKGEKGDSVIHHVKGQNGEPGPRGEIGMPGKNGIPGTPGHHGHKGEKGEKGEAVIVQIKGEKGEVGAQGEKIKGDKGDKGTEGLKGATGRDGPQGPPGARGFQGDKGEPGIEGRKGHKGEPGEPGPPGNVPISEISLMKGPKGSQGSPGSRGPQGYKGKTGPRGPTGPKGPQGAQGARGPMGPTGPKGDKGAPGEKGDTPFIDVEKLKGDKGDRGERGPAGEPGKPGINGKCESCNSLVASGLPGPPGPPGPPGTSITGPKGEPGKIIKSSYFTFDDHGTLDDEDDFYTAGTVIYKTSRALFKRTSSIPLGTLAFIIEEEKLLLRAGKGWKFVITDSIVHTSTGVWTPPQYKTIQSSKIQANKPKSDIHIRVVALNRPYRGNMLTAGNRTGRNAANQECFRQGAKSFRTNNFVAFLANNVDDLKTVGKTGMYSYLPVKNAMNEVLFHSWSSMFNGSGALLTNASIYSFNGKNILIDPTWRTKAVWHGSNSYGTRSPRASCENWESDSPHIQGAASSLRSHRLLEQERYPCDMELIVLCVEVTSHASRQSLRRRHHRSRMSMSDTAFNNRIPDT